MTKLTSLNGEAKTHREAKEAAEANLAKFSGITVAEAHLLRAIHGADGMLYLLEEKTGTVVLLKASPRGWDEQGRFTLSPQTQLRNPTGMIWTHPVVSGGRLYLRDQELLFCFDVSGQ